MVLILTLAPHCHVNGLLRRTGNAIATAAFMFNLSDRLSAVRRHRVVRPITVSFRLALLCVPDSSPLM